MTKQPVTSYLYIRQGNFKHYNNINILILFNIKKYKINNNNIKKSKGFKKA